MANRTFEAMCANRSHVVKIVFFWFFFFIFPFSAQINSHESPPLSARMRRKQIKKHPKAEESHTSQKVCTEGSSEMQNGCMIHVSFGQMVAFFLVGFRGGKGV